ncbi:MAG: hypothetical protein MUO77_18065 [Anaerolineales bacterium]|nr:hypothetical protein [Anaerolineales bacterium]
MIPKLRLRLDSVDDEMELVAILQEFCRLERRQVEVYFDGAPSPTQVRPQPNQNQVSAGFPPQKLMSGWVFLNQEKK